MATDPYLASAMGDITPDAEGIPPLFQSELDKITDPGDCYKSKFIDAFVLLDKNARFDVSEGLRKKFKDFRVTEFNRRVKESDRTSVVSINGKQHVPVPRGKVDLLTQTMTDTGNSQRFVATYAGTVRYCHSFDAWLIWDGRRWARDESELIRKLGREAMIEFLRQADATFSEAARKFAHQSLDSRRIANMLLESRHELSVTVDDLDKDPDRMAFLNGEVNLKTGELTAHNQAHLITKLVRFNYTPDAQCTLFMATLAQLMGSGPDADENALKRADTLVSTLQYCFGYSLTGHTSEKVVFIAFGSGNNGKSMILSLFRNLLKEHSTLIQIESLMSKQENNNSQSDLADLRGARYVMTSETEEGQRLAEGKLKRICQGMGDIKAVRKYENPITFAETHKLWIDANHKPVIRGTDEAIWNRIFPIPFQVTITKEEIDRTLPKRLLEEAEGILAWAVSGAVAWYQHGLLKPDEVTSVLQSYREEMDQVGRFIDERCVVDESLSASAADLYRSYKGWAESSGEYPMSKRALGTKLTENRGVTSDHTRNGAVYRGIGLAPTWGK